jgi:hypothetical protein
MSYVPQYNLFSTVYPILTPCHFLLLWRFLTTTGKYVSDLSMYDVASMPNKYVSQPFQGHWPCVTKFMVRKLYWATDVFPVQISRMVFIVETQCLLSVRHETNPYTHCRLILIFKVVSSSGCLPRRRTGLIPGPSMWHFCWMKLHLSFVWVWNLIPHIEGGK